MKPDTERKIRLAVDTHHLLLETAGTRRVTINLLYELNQKKEIQLFELKSSYHLKKRKNISGKLMQHLLRFFWVHLHLPLLCFLKKIDVLLSPEFNTPLFTTCRKYVIVHDAHIRAQREFNSSLWFYFYYIPFIEQAIKRADLIITISNFSKEQIIKWMKVDEKKIIVLYWGIDKIFLPENAYDNFSSLATQFHIATKKYLLFVGTFEARKNIERIVEAFGLLQNRPDKNIQDIKLVIAGNVSTSKFSDRSFAIKELIKKHDLTEKIIFCGYIPDESLAALYSNAFCLLFPSLYEGFGFPIIEGFASGVPVITSNICSMPEIASDAALLVDPFSVVDIESKIYSLFENITLRDQLISSGKKRVQEFSWITVGDTFLNAIKTFESKPKA